MDIHQLFPMGMVCHWLVISRLLPDYSLISSESGHIHPPPGRCAHATQPYQRLAHRPNSSATLGQCLVCDRGTLPSTCRPSSPPPSLLLRRRTPFLQRADEPTLPLLCYCFAVCAPENCDKTESNLQAHLLLNLIAGRKLDRIISLLNLKK